MKTEYYVGLDVHKDTIQMAVLGSRRKEPVTAKGLANDALKAVKALAPYQEKGAVQVAYEAGCMGYTLYRTLTEFGFDCRVIPPNKVFHRGGTEEKVKTDKRDTLDIAWMLRRDEREPTSALGLTPQG